jgi:hypothetical protein
MSIFNKLKTASLIIATGAIMVSTTSLYANCAILEPTWDSATSTYTGGGVAPDPAKCGNGVLDEGECCDLGDEKNGKIGDPATGKTAHGCHSNCSVDSSSGWECNDPAQKYSGYAQWVAGMNKLYVALINANKPGALVAEDKCANAPGQNGRVDKDVSENTFANGNELTGTVILSTCADYETAFERFRGYNASHALDRGIYAQGENIRYKNGTDNYNDCSTTSIIGKDVKVSSCP